MDQRNLNLLDQRSPRGDLRSGSSRGWPFLGWPAIEDFEAIEKWFELQYPLVNIQKAIENGHRNSGFSHLKWGFSIAMLVYQRVNAMRLYMVRYHGIAGGILYIGNVYIYIYINIIGFLEDCQSMVLWNGYLTIVNGCYLTIVMYKPWIEY